MMQRLQVLESQQVEARVPCCNGSRAAEEPWRRVAAQQLLAIPRREARQCIAA